jgi:predicted transcriptional regulator
VIARADRNKTATFRNNIEHVHNLAQRILLICGILLTMEQSPKRRVTYTEHDKYNLSEKEREIYHAIVKETILKNRRCAQLSLSDLEKMTGIKKNTVAYHLKKLKQRRLIEIDDTQKTNTICIVTLYKEIYPYE